MNLDLEWWNSFSKVSSVLLAALTFVAGGIALLTERQITARQAAQLAEIGRDIADAKTKQATAETRLNETALEVEKARNDGRDNARKLEEQRERAANAEKELLRLQETLAPRRIPDAMEARLIKELARAEPKGFIDIEYVVGDPEAETFGRQVLAVVRQAGWRTTPLNAGAYAGNTPRGFGIMVHAVSRTPDHARSLRAAFISAGSNLGEIVESPNTVPDGHVKLMIGHKRQ